MDNMYDHDSPIISERDLRIQRLAKEYLEQTEAYDQRICSLRDGQGIAMPLGCQERALIDNNARSFRRHLLNTNPDIEARELDEELRRIRG